MGREGKLLTGHTEDAAKIHFKIHAETYLRTAI